MSANLYLTERKYQRIAVAVFLLALSGASFGFQNQRELFSGVAALPDAPSALTAFAPLAEEEAETTTRVLRVPTGFPGIPQRRRLAPPRSAVLAQSAEAPANLPAVFAADPPAPAFVEAEAELGPAAPTDIPGIVTEDQLALGPVPPQGTLEVQDTPPDIGAVPEPATWMMLIVGFLVMGSAMRADRKNARFPSKI